MPDKLFSAVLAILILGAIGAIAYFATNPDLGESYTEFYLLGTEGQAGGYPEELNLGQTATVVVGIVNNEHEAINYRVEIRSATIKIGELGPLLLADGKTLEEEMSFALTTVGERQKVEFWLFKEDGKEPDLSIYIFIDVAESG